VLVLFVPGALFAIRATQFRRVSLITCLVIFVRSNVNTGKKIRFDAWRIDCINVFVTFISLLNLHPHHGLYCLKFVRNKGSMINHQSSRPLS
jgi:hypothetical protein